MSPSSYTGSCVGRGCAWRLWLNDPDLRRRCSSRPVSGCAAVVGACGLLIGCAAPEAKFSMIADLPAELQSAVLFRDAGQDDQGRWLVRVDVDQRIEGRLPDRALLIPFTDERPWAREGQRGRPIVPVRVWPLEGERPVVMQAVVDTGAASTFILSGLSAAEGDVWLSAEIGPHEGIGFVGPVPAGQGLVRRLEVGPVAFSPAEVKVNTAQEGRSASLGLSAFLVFGGIVFDWENRVIVALPRGRAIRVDPGWTEVAWEPIPVTTLTPVGHAEEAGAVGEESWSVRTEFRGMPVVQAAIAGESLRAVLDTGGDGDLASLRRLRVEGKGRPRLVGSHGRTQMMREHTLAGDVRIGPVVFERPMVVVPDPEAGRSEGHSEASIAFFDAVVGVELLRRQPVWFDFERGVVRFWTGEGGLPALTATRLVEQSER